MDIFIGTIKLFPYNFAPYGWVLCNGTSLSVQQNTALYALIGNNYGGDRNNFNVPDLKNASPYPVDQGPQMTYYICTLGIFPPHN